MSGSVAKSIAREWSHADGCEKTMIAPIPKLLMLELTNACNLKCIMCHNRNMTRKKGSMTVELGMRAIREAAQLDIKEVALFTTGEPLLYKQLDKLINEAKRLRLRSYITSNGLLLDKKTAEMICSEGLDSFKFSIDASSSEEYEKVRINGDYERLVDNVRLLRRIRDKLNSPMTIICASVMANPSKEKIDAFRAQFAHICDSILISEMNNLGGKIRLSNHPSGEDVKVLPPCRLLWDRINICYDGKITACCVDFDAELVYSDYNNTSLEHAWNNDTIQEWRRKHLAGETIDMPMCGKCNTPFLMNSDRIIELNK